MRKSILLAQVWSTRKTTIFWSTTLTLAVIFTMATFKPIAQELGLALGDIGIVSLFGGASAFNSASGWLGLHIYSLLLPIALAVTGVVTGANAIGREEKSGTIELLLSSALSRRRIVLEKAGGVAVQLAIICLSVWLAVILGRDTFALDISLKNAAYATFSAFLVGLVFAYISMAMQAVFSKRSLAIGICISLLAVTLVIDWGSALIEPINNMKYISILHYYDGQEALLYGLKRTSAAILTLTSLAALAITYFGFNRRDA